MSSFFSLSFFLFLLEAAAWGEVLKFSTKKKQKKTKADPECVPGTRRMAATKDSTLGPWIFEQRKARTTESFSHSLAFHPSKCGVWLRIALPFYRRGNEA